MFSFLRRKNSRIRAGHNLKKAIATYLSGMTQSERKSLQVKICDDFSLDGRGTNAAWQRTTWHALLVLRGKVSYRTAFKIMYSKTGIYCLFQCEDEQIIATKTENNADLWTEDVVEAFFWPDENFPVYFEYELSPKNVELPILVPNCEGQFYGWLPWGAQASRATRHETHIQEVNGKPTGWTAEFFIPFDLLKPLPNCPPTSGSKWRANFYRIDHDAGESNFCWNRVDQHYHEYNNFGVIEFE